MLPNMNHLIIKLVQVKELGIAKFNRDSKRCYLLLFYYLKSPQPYKFSKPVMPICSGQWIECIPKFDNTIYDSILLLLILFFLSDFSYKIKKLIKTKYLCKMNGIFNENPWITAPWRWPELRERQL